MEDNNDFTDDLKAILEYYRMCSSSLKQNLIDENCVLMAYNLGLLDNAIQRFTSDYELNEEEDGQGN